MEWTFLNAPLQRVMRRVADDAPIDATIDVVSSFATSGEQVQLLRDIKEERNKLRSVLEVIRCLLADAEEKGYCHEHVAGRWLGQVRDAIWDAEDVLDEYSTDAAVLHRVWDKHAAGSGLHADLRESEVWNYFCEKLKAYQLDKVRGRLDDVAEDGRKQLGLQAVDVGAPPPHNSPQPAPTGGSRPDDPRKPESADRPQQLIIDHKLIRASYEHLAPNLKECFAYCCLFPQDYEFQKDELVQLWMAQGFVESGSGGSEEGGLSSLGKMYFDELLSSSLLERKQQEEYDPSFYTHSYAYDSEIAKDDLDTYVMRDPTHDLAVSVSQDYCIVPGEELAAGELPDKVRHLSRALYSYAPASLPADVLGSFEKLRTLLLFPDVEHRSMSLMESSEHLVRFLEGVVFTRLRRLRVLRLQNCYFTTLPASIDNLRHLRFLDLSTSTIQALPESVGDLYNLEGLILDMCIFLKEIPQGAFRNLTNLRCLNLGHCDEITELPESLGNCCNLRVLNLTTSRAFEKLPESVGNLTSLVALRALGTNIKRVPGGVGNLTSLRILRLPANFEELPESLGNLRNLQVLWVCSGGMLKRLPESFCNLTELTSLNLANSGLRELPEWLYNLPKLQELNLTGVDCKTDDALRHLVNERGVVFWYYGKHTSIADPPAEGGDGDGDGDAA